MNQDNPFTIFLSYSWSDSEAADEIERDLKDAGLRILKDKIDIEYKGSIREFMRKINTTDYVVLLISPSYLQSSNCMYEILELLKDSSYTQRILPILLKQPNIFDAAGRFELVEYWQEKINVLNKKIRTLDSSANVPSLIQDLEHFTKIRASIDEFLKVIIDMSCIEFIQLKKQKYNSILKLIGLSLTSVHAEILAISLIDDVQEKEIAVHKLLQKFPDNIHVSFLKGNFALEKEEWNLALTIFIELLDKTHDKCALHNNMGIAYKGLNRFDEAIEQFEKAILLESTYSPAYLNLSSIYIDNLDYEKAKFNIELALKFNKDSAEANYNYALFLHDNRNLFGKPKDLEKIKYHYLEGIRLHSISSKPTRALPAHFGLANLLFENSDFAEARLHYEACIQINPKYFQAHCNYGNLLKKHFNELELAGKHFEVALEINPLDHITHNNLANLYWQMNKLELADNHFRKVQKIDSTYKPENYIRFKVMTGYK